MLLKLPFPHLSLSQGLSQAGMLLGLPCPTPEAPVRGPRSLLELEQPLGVMDPTLPMPGVTTWAPGSASAPECLQCN